MIRVLLLLLLAGSASAETLAERGKYLAIVGDCVACHTAPGGAEFAGGRALATPFGTLLTANITPDAETGIGRYGDEDFLRAMQHGIARDGRHLYPAFPYPWFTRAMREDLLAIRAWLATLPAVRNDVRVNQLAFPFDIRAGMVFWNALYFRPGAWTRQADRSDAWNRGAYLVEGLGHCGACHTPKTALGGDDVARSLAGGLVMGWNAPALDGDMRTGLGRWSVDEIVAFLATGHTARASAGGPMAEVVENSTALMTPSDLRAIAVYLKDRSASPAAGWGPPDAATMQTGSAIYADACAACHTMTGAGVAQLFPALAGSAAVQAEDPASVLRVILHGARSAATAGAPTGPAMPGFGWKLSDAQAAMLATYVRNAWGNAAAPVSAAQARRARNTP